jgi:hypothetical protein
LRAAHRLIVVTITTKLGLGGLAAAAAVLAVLYVDAAGGRSDERRRATDLAAREASARADAATLRTEATAARQRADAADARFTAVEPCLRAIIATPTPPPGSKTRVRELTQKELDELLRKSKGPIPPATGAQIFPACKDVAKQLK